MLQIIGNRWLVVGEQFDGLRRNDHFFTKRDVARHDVRQSIKRLGRFRENVLAAGDRPGGGGGEGGTTL